MNERSPKETIKVAGYQKEDATRYQKPWEDQPYQFLVYPSTSPRRERLYLPLSTRSSNPHPTMTSQSSLKEGKLKEETPKTKETCQKDGKELLPSKNKPPSSKKWSKRKRMQILSYHLPWHRTYLLGGSLPQKRLSDLLPKKIDIKNQRLMLSAIRQASAIPIYPA